MTPGEKADVLHSVSAELITMFGTLTNHYHRPAYVKGLPELEKIETFLKAKLLEYDPICADILSVN